ncbi:MAG: TonB-dependent receptor [Desulfobacterales bacterium]|nr:TonB-dependent receptor [Desulfobacterales bacterium]
MKSYTNIIKTIFKEFAVLFMISLAVTAIPVQAADRVDRPEIEVGRVKDKPLGVDEEKAVRELLQILKEKTEIATKTRMNIDFVPGMVSVLHGKDLLARGIRTVYEALALIPGVDLSMFKQGIKVVRFRGIGQTKLLLNGIALNANIGSGKAEANNLLFNIPIEQVDRIEVIRGPGSAIYGEFAYTGVINVITCKQGNQIFAGWSNFETKRVGGVLSVKDPDREFAFSLNVAGTDSDGGDVQTGEDVLYGLGLGWISNAPGATNEKEENRSVICTLDYKGFSLVGHFIKSGYGDHFGTLNALPPPGGRIVNEEENWSIEARQCLQISDDFTSKIKLGWSEYIAEADELLGFPSGFPYLPPIVYTDGMICSAYYKERKTYGGAEIDYRGVEQHTLLLGFDFAVIEELAAWQEANYDPETLAPLPGTERFTGDKNFIAEGLKRKIVSGFLQDQYDVGDQLTLTGGIRFDDYDDVGSRLTPRLAACYRLTDTQILKFQYAEAFRPPSFTEMYVQNNPLCTGNPGLEPETIQTYELGYIYNSGLTIARATLFHSDLEDLIVLDPSRKYCNRGGANLDGLELEFVRQMGRFAKLNANVSYVDAKDKDTDKDLPYVANWTGNLGLIVQPLPQYSIALQYRYVGECTRAPDDRRDKLDAYDTLDLTASIFNLGFKGMTLRAGIKNLFDEDIVYPSPAGTYPEDYPRPGREWWLKVSHEF